MVFLAKGKTVSYALKNIEMHQGIDKIQNVIRSAL
jgi:hypothetical protein